MGHYSTSDFLNYDPYTQEYEISNIDSRWPIIALLGEKENNSVEGKTKLAKELFFEMALEELRMPLDFKKHPNGPYTKQITRDTEELEEEGFIEKNKKYRYKDTRCIEFKLTESGIEKYEKDIKPKLPDFALNSLRKAKGVDRSGTNLARHCYRKFKLKKDSTSREKWVEQRKDWIKQIKKDQDDLLESKFKKHVGEDLRYTLMMPISYSRDLIEEGELKPYEESFQVESGVILMSISRITNHVRGAMRIVNGKEFDEEDQREIKNHLERLDRSFYFLNSYAEENRVYKSIYSDNDPLKLMNESDRQRVEEKINS